MSCHIRQALTVVAEAKGVFKDSIILLPFFPIHYNEFIIIMEKTTVLFCYICYALPIRTDNITLSFKKDVRRLHTVGLPLNTINHSKAHAITFRHILYVLAVWTKAKIVNIVIFLPLKAVNHSRVLTIIPQNIRHALAVGTHNNFTNKFGVRAKRKSGKLS